MAHLGYRSGEYHNLIQFANTLHKLIDARPLDYVHVMVLSLNFYRYCEVGLMENLAPSVYPDTQVITDLSP